jgi:hypothetical protein
MYKPAAELKPFDVRLVVNQTNNQNCRRLDIYLANNIAQKIIKNTGQSDPDFEFLGWEYAANGGSNPVPGELCFHNTANITRAKLSVSYGLNAGEFRFTYKSHPGTCHIRTSTEQHNTKTHIIPDEQINKSIVLEFDDPKNNHLVLEMIKQAGAYIDKYVLECDDGENTIKIFCNDEGYWDKVMSKRKRRLDTIYLPKADKNLIIDDITHFLLPSTIDRYESIGRTHKRVYLFEGLPGTGKSSFILALASHFGYDLAIISFTEKVTDGTLTRLLKNLPPKTILVMEDIDVLFTDRKKNDEHKNMVTFSGILNNLDGITTQDGFLCFITTNYKNLLDTALLRPGRIDRQLRFDTATREQIHDMFIKFMGELYTAEKFKEFYSGFAALGISTTISLIQEYLFQYIDNPDAAISNLEQLRQLYETAANKSANLYT